MTYYVLIAYIVMPVHGGTELAFQVRTPKRVGKQGTGLESVVHFPGFHGRVNYQESFKSGPMYIHQQYHNSNRMQRLSMRIFNWIRPIRFDGAPTAGE